MIYRTLPQHAVLLSAPCSPQETEHISNTLTGCSCSPFSKRVGADHLQRRKGIPHSDPYWGPQISRLWYWGPCTEIPLVFLLCHFVQTDATWCYTFLMVMGASPWPVSSLTTEKQASNGTVSMHAMCLHQVFFFCVRSPTISIPTSPVLRRSCHWRGIFQISGIEGENSSLHQLLPGRLFSPCGRADTSSGVVLVVMKTQVYKSQGECDTIWCWFFQHWPTVGNAPMHSTSFNIVSKPLSRSNLPFSIGFGNCRISFRIFKRHTVQSRWVSPKAEHTFLSSFLQIGYRNFTSSCISGTHVLSLGVAQKLPQILIDKPSQEWSVSCRFYRKPIGQHRCITKHAGGQRETPPAKCKGSVWQCVGRKKVGAQGGSGDKITVWLPSNITR